MANRMVN